MTVTAAAPPVPYGRQTIDDDDIAAVVAVLRGDRLTQGPAVDAFEAAVADATGARHAVALANGTAALHAACAVAGLGPGDRVGVPAMTFAASANAVRYVGATPVLLDVDPTTGNLDPAAVPAGLDGLVVVHFAGRPVDLGSLAHRPRVVIEDAAHALGAATPSGPVGNTAHSDLVCFSFHPVKPVTTGEGGVVTTADPDLAAALRRFRSHGIVPTPERGAWAYEVVDEGFNYRLSDIQAALGTSQMRKLDAFVERRRVLAARWDALLAPLAADGLVTLPPPVADGVRHGWHLYVVQVPARTEVHRRLHAQGIAVQVHYVPLHHHRRFAAFAPPGGLPGVDALYAGALSLPLFPALDDATQDRVAAVVEATVREIAAGEVDASEVAADPLTAGVGS